MSRLPLVVIGAGPAGCSAAIAAAEAGLPVTLIDDAPQAGGQIYRQAPAALQKAPPTASNRGDELRQRLRQLDDKITTLFNTRVWGLFDGHRIAVLHDGSTREIEAERLVLAPGAYEFVPPFPGWTLPGVMTPGGAQTLIKASRVLPGRRALIAGTGPFLLVVANYLHQAGVDVVAVVEAVRRREVLGAVGGLLSQPKMLREGWRHLSALRRSGIPLLTGHVIVAARGEDEVREVVIAPCDKQWRPDERRSRVFEVDTACVGYGFVPRIQLPQLAGCRLVYDDMVGGWRPESDAMMRSSDESVWCAGDGAGVAGAVVAELEGRLAGWGAANDAGVLGDGDLYEQAAATKRKLHGMRRFRAALDRLSRIRPGLAELPDEDTIVCRCEELTLGEVQAAVTAGSRLLRELKVATRLGMGPCQGQMCWPGVARMIASCDGNVEQLGPLSVRPPLGNLTLGDVADVVQLDNDPPR